VYLEQIGTVTVEGEISELKLSQSKWIFLTIKDQSASLSVFAVLYQIPNFHSLSEGMLVKATGVARLYQKTGRFSLFAESIVPSGEGALSQALAKLKARLTAEGLFAPERKRALPFFPQRIALLTAKGSQAEADFLKVLKARQGGLTIYFCPIKVQGNEAVQSILKGLEVVEKKIKKIDAVVLIRGGGSLEDLSAFNDERVVRRLFTLHSPVVVGVGHEKDWSLCDLVADLRASTPSNAAELLVRSRSEILFQINALLTNLTEKISIRVNQRRQFLNYFFNFLALKLESHRNRLDSLIRSLGNLDYRKVLQRGYSLTFDNQGQLVRDLGKIKLDETIITKFYLGKLTSRVSQKNDA
jgi:exodeoxyribonuclease VII large subunit